MALVRIIEVDGGDAGYSNLPTSLGGLGQNASALAAGTILVADGAGGFTAMAGMLLPTGMIIDYAGSSAPAGWLICNGDTLGDSFSGATHTGTAYEALFKFLWNQIANADLGMLNASGSPQPRGANANSDWASHYRMPLFDLVTTGLFRRAKMSGRNLGSVQDDALQNITGTISGGQENLSGTGAFAAGSAGSSNRPSNGSASTAAATFDASRVVRTDTETRPKNIALIPLIKL